MKKNKKILFSLGMLLAPCSALSLGLLTTLKDTDKQMNRQPLSVMRSESITTNNNDYAKHRKNKRSADRVLPYSRVIYQKPFPFEVELGTIRRKFKDVYEKRSKIIEYEFPDVIFDDWKKGIGWIYDVTGPKVFYIKVQQRVFVETDYSEENYWVEDNRLHPIFINFEADHWTVTKWTRTNKKEIVVNFPKQPPGTYFQDATFIEDNYNQKWDSLTEPFAKYESRFDSEKFGTLIIPLANFEFMAQKSRLFYLLSSLSSLKCYKNLSIYPVKLRFTVYSLGEDMQGPNNVRVIIRRISNISISWKKTWQALKQDDMKLRALKIKTKFSKKINYSESYLKGFIKIFDVYGDRVEAYLSNVWLEKNGKNSRIHFKFNEYSDQAACYGSGNFSIPVTVID